MPNAAIRRILTGLALLTPAAALAAGEIVMHRDPGCSCCTKWAALLREGLGRKVKIIDNSRRADFRQRMGVPQSLGSCHTAVIDGLAFEGHVPIEDVKRLIAQRPQQLSGLAVAGMPLGSPGMVVPGAKAQRYDVIAFGPGGERVFARH